jgi:hypothetical protein
MPHHWRDQLITLIDSYQPGPRDKALLALRALAAQGRLSEAMCQFHFRRLLLEPPRCVGSLAQPPTLQEWRSAVKVEAPVGVLAEVDRAEFGVRLSDRVEHWGFCGGTGAGKTVGLRRLGLSVATTAKARPDQRVVLLVIEIKRDYADFISILGLPCVRVRNVDSMAWFGTQAPAGVSSRDWAMELAVILAARCGLKHATTSVARMLTWLVEHLNRESGGDALWPDLQLLCDVAVAAPPFLFAGKDDYERSAIQILDGLAHALGPFARSFRGIDLEQFFSEGTSVVVDLSTLGPPAQWVVIDVLLSQLVVGRLARDQKCDRAEILVLLDESDELVTESANATFPGKQSPLLRLVRRGREYGILAALGINDLAGASEALLNNIKNLVVLNQDAPACIAMAARALMLDRAAAGILSALEPGEAVMRLAGWRFPLLGRVTLVPPHRGSTATPAPEFSAVPAKRLAELPELEEALAQATGELRRGRKVAVDAPDKIVAQVHDVIADWVLRPGKPLVRIWETLKINQPGKQEAIRKALAPEFADVRDERFSSTKVAILQPTDAGYALVGRRSPDGQGNGDTVHRNGAWWVRDWSLQQQYAAHLEWPVPGTHHRGDVGVCINGKWHVFEIAVTCFDNLADAVRASLVVSNAVESVTIVTTLKSEHARVRRVLATPDLGGVMDRVHLSTFDYYLREVYP